MPMTVFLSFRIKFELGQIDHFIAYACANIVIERGNETTVCPRQILGNRGHMTQVEGKSIFMQYLMIGNMPFKLEMI